MSAVKTAQIEKNLYEITFSIDHDTFEKAVNAAYRKSVKNINIPGFRRGKAPRAIIEKMYGKGVFYEDAINDLIPTVYPDAAKESGLDIVGQPEFDIDTIDENGAVLKAKVYTKPEAKIEGYKGIAVTKTVAPVTDADVDADIERVRERNARMIEVTDRAAENGDIANIDYKGSVDGKLFDGGSAEKYDLTLGGGQFIPGFEDQIVGHKIGEEFDVNVKFPEDYHAEELKGADAVFACKLNGLKVKELPALDDEFARDVSDFDTLDAYKADVKAKLEEKNEKAADADVEEQLINALIEKLDADIPEVMYVQETENFVRDYDNRLRMQGLDLSTYFKYTGMTLDQLRAQMRPDAERQVKTRLALETIAKLENVTVADDEVEEEMKRLADAYGMELDKVKELVEREGVEADLKVKKAVEIVKNSADVSAKKPAAKKTTKKAAPKAEETETSEEAPKPAAKKATKKAAPKAEGETDEKKPAAKKTAAKKDAE
ncbi:MAG: trigger factor [Clostridia bacterium]|nr:trigger factor [Clostridia bacterium]